MRIVAVEGIIAAGKRVMLDALAERLAAKGYRVCAIPEPVDAWHATGALQWFYGDISARALPFQMYAQATRIAVIADAYRKCPDADVYLLERSPATDAVFMAMLASRVTPTEMAMYDACRDTYAHVLPLDLREASVVFIQTSVAEAMRRLAGRGRSGEITDAGAANADAPKPKTEGVTAEYQLDLLRAHEAFLLGREVPGLVLPPPVFRHVVALEPAIADSDFRTPGAQREYVVSEVIRRLGL